MARATTPEGARRRDVKWTAAWMCRSSLHGACRCTVPNGWGRPLEPGRTDSGRLFNEVGMHRRSGMALAFGSVLALSTIGAQSGTPPTTAPQRGRGGRGGRSEEDTSELQSPYVISYAVFCLKKA